LPLDARSFERRQKIIEIIEKHGPLSFKEIRERTSPKVTDRTLHNDLRLFKELGVITYDDSSSKYNAKRNTSPILETRTFLSKADYELSMKHSRKVLNLGKRPPEDTIFFNDWRAEDRFIEDIILGTNDANKFSMDHFRTGYPTQWSLILSLREHAQKYDRKLNPHRVAIPSLNPNPVHPFFDSLVFHEPWKAKVPSSKPLPAVIKQEKGRNKTEETDEYTERIYDPAKELRELIGKELLENLRSNYLKIQGEYEKTRQTVENGTPILGNCEACPNVHIEDRAS